MSDCLVVWFMFSLGDDEIAHMGTFFWFKGANLKPYIACEESYQFRSKSSFRINRINFLLDTCGVKIILGISDKVKGSCATRDFPIFLFHD